jgi:L-threonylcarbamoyladenylate synthase
MKIYNIDNNININILNEICDRFQSGEIGIIPTDTVYGIAGIVGNINVEEKIYKIKNRDESKNFVMQTYDINIVKKMVKEINDSAEKLMKKFFPGPITLIFNSSDYLKSIYNWKYDTIGIRIPANDVTLNILRKLDSPIFVTSANISGQKQLDNIDDIIKLFDDKIDFIVKDMSNKKNVPSTIIDVTDNKIKILREGVISIETINNILM